MAVASPYLYMKKKGSDAPAAALVQLSGPLGGAPFFPGVPPPLEHHSRSGRLFMVTFHGR